MVQKYLEKFESADAVTSVVFPLNLYEWSSRQVLEVPSAHPVGSDYNFDFLGFGRSSKANAQERVSFIATGTDAAIDSAIQTIKADCFNIGRGKLFTLDNAGNRLWAWARLANAPKITVTYNGPRLIPVNLDFIRMSDWFDDTQTTGTEVITATFGSFDIVNSGDAYVKNIIFRFRANTVGGLSNPALIHDTNGHQFSSTRDSTSADDELKVDCGKPSVEWSTDDGATYNNDYANFDIGSLQIGFMILAPGTNTINYLCSGAPNFDIDYSFYPAYN